MAEKLKEMKEMKENLNDVFKAFESKFECNDLKRNQLIANNSTPDSLHLREKINELIDKLQLADSKAKAFYNECSLLKQRLKIAEESRRKTEDELRLTQETVRELKEELNTTSVNYQHQLSTMSEHLATMNERLTSQKDEIESLKLELKNRKSKR